MRCLYFLSPSLVSAHKISDDLHDAGVRDWFVHVVSNDEAGLAREHLHSSNYLETLDIVRESIVGALIGFLSGLVLALIFKVFQPLGQEIPLLAYTVIVAVVTMFGCWVGGLDGWAHRNRKIERFMPEIEAGKNLILVYATRNQEQVVTEMMSNKHTEAKLMASDSRFLNPFSQLALEADKGPIQESGSKLVS